MRSQNLKQDEGTQETAANIENKIMPFSSSSQAMEQELAALGLTDLAVVHANLDTAALYEHALRRNEVHLSADRAIIALTGQHTGRSPNDKYVVRDETNADLIDWGKVNQPYEPAAFEGIHNRINE